MLIITIVQSNMAKGRIAVVSTFSAANAFVRRVRCAGGQCAIIHACRIIIGRHISLLKSPITVGEIWTPI